MSLVFYMQLYMLRGILLPMLLLYIYICICFFFYIYLISVFFRVLVNIPVYLGTPSAYWLENSVSIVSSVTFQELLAWLYCPSDGSVCQLLQTVWWAVMILWSFYKPLNRSVYFSVDRQLLSFNSSGSLMNLSSLVGPLVFFFFLIYLISVFFGVLVNITVCLGTPSAY